MSHQRDQLFVLQHEKYLIEEYGPLCKLCGFDIDAMTGSNVYMLATAIMGGLKGRAKFIIKGAFCETDYLGALRSMSVRELEELRARIKR
jgi:hypothetical protein